MEDQGFAVPRHQNLEDANKNASDLLGGGGGVRKRKNGALFVLLAPDAKIASFCSALWSSWEKGNSHAAFSNIILRVLF